MFCTHKIISSSLIISKNLNIKMYIRQPRLQVYNNLIGLYDINDKYKYSKIKFSFISYIKFQYSSIKLTNKNLASILFNEFVTTQRFNFLKNVFLTLRNS